MWYRLTDDRINHFHEGKQFNPDMLKAFVRANGFDMTTFSWPKDYAKLLRDGRFPHHYRNIEQNMPPYLDHARIFKNTDTGLMCITYQPYKEACENISTIEQWATNNGLKADVYSPARSWYYPGATCLVVIHLPEVNIKLA